MAGLIAQGQFGKIFHTSVKNTKTGEQTVAAMKVMRDTPAARAEVEIAKEFGSKEHPQFMPVLFSSVVTAKGGLADAFFQDEIFDEEEGESDKVQSLVAFGMPYIPYNLLRIVTAERGPYREGKAIRDIFRQILSAVAFMHEHQYVHKDLKLENILCQPVISPEDDRDEEEEEEEEEARDLALQIYLCDFGFSKKFVPGSKSLKDKQGSPHYSAPELWDSVAYEGPEVDVWALGVCLYILCTGCFPFGGSSHTRIYNAIRAIRKTGLKFPPGARFSDSLKDLLSKMICYDPKKRITISQILQHPWMSEFPKVNVAAESKVNLLASEKSRSVGSLSLTI